MSLREIKAFCGALDRIEMSRMLTTANAFRAAQGDQDSFDKWVKLVTREASK